MNDAADEPVLSFKVSALANNTDISSQAVDEIEHETSNISQYQDGTVSQKRLRRLKTFLALAVAYLFTSC